MAPIPLELANHLQANGQSRLIDYLHRLSDECREALLSQLAAVDWSSLSRVLADSNTAVPLGQLAPPQSIVRLPQTPEESANWQSATAAGEALLASGKVAAMLVAGGQGTRLGFPHPKGMYNIGPVSGFSLFAGFARQILRLEEKYATRIPYCIMTSDVTHAETQAFFETHNYFGLDPSRVHFFQQGVFPSIDANTKELLLSGPTELANSPNGHGGMLAAFQESGLLAKLQSAGIEQLYYHQVDNPGAIVCNPSFLGWHLKHGSSISTKVVAKVNAAERMGVLAAIDGKTQVVEYSDLPPEAAAETNPDGSLRLWAGSTAMHVMSLKFLSAYLASAGALPFHRAFKAVPYYDLQQQQVVKPTSPNAFKFERFIFDLLPAAEVALVVEADRAEEFYPVKNASGTDSPATSQAAIIARAKRWLTTARISTAESQPVEIDPRAATSAIDLMHRIEAGELTTTPSSTLALHTPLAVSGPALITIKSSQRS
jgi:UDP-N-acetylglucosamine/UDP-N-acetylgalactosamine diphosphorylase